MTDNIFYDAYVKTICKTAEDFTPSAISSENWKLIGQYPEIMQKILEAGAKTGKNSTYIQRFYEENPELLNNRELAKKFLFSIYEDRSADAMFKLFPNDKDYFLEDIKEVAQWVKKNPLVLYYKHLDNLQSNEEFFLQMQSYDGLDLSWFKLPCPDNLERIHTWLNNMPSNFNYLPEKYQHDGELFCKVLSGAKNLQEKIFGNAPADMQELLEANCILARSGKLSLLSEDMQCQVSVFFSYCQYLKDYIQIDNFKFLNDIPDMVWKKPKNIILLLETIPELNFKGTYINNYEYLVKKFKIFQKLDSGMATILDSVDGNGQPLYHLGLKMNEVRMSYSSSEIESYLKTGIKELEKAYRVTVYAKEMDRNLPHKGDAVKVKKAKI